MSAALVARDPAIKNPIRWTFVGCCASTQKLNTKNKVIKARRMTLLLTHPSVQNPKLFHLMTLSALASTLGGIVTPICFAVLRLMMNSNVVGCYIGSLSGCG